LGGNAHAINKNVKVLVVDSKETELEGNAAKAKYTVKSRNQSAGRSHNILVYLYNSSFERVQDFI